MLLGLWMFDENRGWESRWENAFYSFKADNFCLMNVSAHSRLIIEFFRKRLFNDLKNKQMEFSKFREKPRKCFSSRFTMVLLKLCRPSTDTLGED